MLKGLVSIIIVNYNGKGLLKDCLESLLTQSYREMQVILVDNASTDGSKEFVEQYYPNIKLIKLKENKGFSGGNIEGLKHAEGEYLMLINNDVTLHRDCIRNLIETISPLKEVGIGAPKIINYYLNKIDSAGDGFSTILKAFKRGEGLEISYYNYQEYIFGACAGAAIYRRKMIDEIGFFDDDFFLIHEDTDLNFRAQLMGWKVLYVPSAIAYHKVRSTIGEMSDLAVYYSLRNSELVRIKNVPLMIFFRCLPAYILGSILDLFYFACKHGKIKIFLKAKKDALKLLPKMLKKRKYIIKRKIVNDSYIYNLLSPIYEKSFFITKAKKFLKK
ncbi:MAG: glycosyltransferase family 2 protein [Thermodesulfovibrionales bacterium]|nr:glycosyltransferase family 2 protein [Thermodesulfovibrionales bacterium]